MPLPDASTSYAADFAPALLDPGRPAPEIASGRHGNRPGRRFDVYRNNVTSSLVDALADIFPATQRILGAPFFRGMARLHIRETPPASPLLFDYGRDFAGFVERFEHTRDMPWLADVARIERAWLDAYHAADAKALGPSGLAVVAAGNLADVCFTAHPATRVIRSRFSAVTIFAANRSDGEVIGIDASGPEDALVTRPALEVAVRRLPSGGAAFLSTLLEGGRLGEAASAAFEENADFDLAANIAGMIEAGAFAAVSAGRPTGTSGEDHG